MFTPSHTNSTSNNRNTRESSQQTDPEYRKYVDVTEPLLKKAKEYIAEHYMGKFVMLGLDRNDNERGYPNCVFVGANMHIGSIPESVEVTDDAGIKHNIPVKKEFCGMAVFAAAFPSLTPGV